MSERTEYLVNERKEELADMSGVEREEYSGKKRRNIW